MILTGKQIEFELDQGGIHINPFDPKHLGPNSYDLTLGSKLIVYSVKQLLDMKKKAFTQELTIPEEGIVLKPGVLYLASTNETAVSRKYVPMFEGRSSMGRWGVMTHITAGFGDIGWGYSENGECLYPTWTLEIAVIHPIRVYSGIRIGQVYFVKPYGPLTFYEGKYSRQKGPQASLGYKDF